ncbi:MAG: HPr family phosphocarrier protein [Lentisphaerota bacterium]
MLEDSECSHEIEIKNTLGLHARPASLFVKTASNFECEITVEKESEVVNGKSLMGLLMLSAGYGTIIRISAKGKDCEVAVKAIIDLITRKFDEE